MSLDFDAASSGVGDFEVSFIRGSAEFRSSPSSEADDAGAKESERKLRSDPVHDDRWRAACSIGNHCS